MQKRIWRMKNMKICKRCKKEYDEDDLYYLDYEENQGCYMFFF